jgi:hypothetical protein
MLPARRILSVLHYVRLIFDELRGKGISLTRKSAVIYTSLAESSSFPDMVQYRNKKEEEVGP